MRITKPPKSGVFKKKDSTIKDINPIIIKIIYLDQNIWIELAKGWYSKKGESYNTVLKLKEKIKNKDLIVVISIIHFFETLKIKNEKRRENLLNFMMDISEGNVISPFSEEIINKEIYNMFRRRFSLEEIDIKKEIIGKGIPYILGSEWFNKLIEKYKIPEHLKKQVMNLASSTKMLKTIFSSPDHIAHNQKQIEDLNNLKTKFNEVREKERIYKDKDFGNRVIMIKYFIWRILPKINEIILRLLLNKDFILKKGHTKKDFIKIFQEIPSAYTYFFLIEMRDRNMTRPIHEHDLYDIMSLTVAIPYCDIVVGEKMFIGIAKQTKLDKIYSTILLSSIKELDKYLT